MHINGDYKQTPPSVWTVYLTKTTPHITKITLDGDATFQDGTVLQVLTSDFTPDVGEEFTLMDAVGDVIEEGANGLVLGGQTVTDDWTLTVDTTNDLVKVKYK